jgi:hypothetical protein
VAGADRWACARAEHGLSRHGSRTAGPVGHTRTQPHVLCTIGTWPGSKGRSNRASGCQLVVKGWSEGGQKGVRGDGRGRRGGWGGCGAAAKWTIACYRGCMPYPTAPPRSPSLASSARENVCNPCPISFSLHHLHSTVPLLCSVWPYLLSHPLPSWSL